MGTLVKLVVGGVLLAVCGFAALGFRTDPIADYLTRHSYEALAPQKAGWAAIRIDGRTAYLSGVAPSEAARDQALAAVDDVWGVRTVYDETTLPPIASPYRWDAQKLAGGGLTFSGSVPSDDDREALAAAVGGLSSDPTIDDGTALARGAPDDQWLDAATVGATVLANLDEGSATLIGRELTITGSSKSAAAIGAAQAAASAAMPEGYTVSADFRLEPYSLTIERTAEGLLLEGGIPDDAGAQALADSAVANSPGIAVDDQLVRIDGAPGSDWVQAAAVAAGQMAGLNQGSATLTGKTLTLNGTTDRVSRIIGSARTLKTALPPGYEGNATVAFAADPSTPSIDDAAACQQQFNSLLTGSSIQFETDSAEIQVASYDLLDKVAYTAQQCRTFHLKVDGHTDNTGTDEINIPLSQRRADAIAGYLGIVGVPPENLTAEGFGAASPIADNGTAEGRQQNRRVEILVSESGQ